LFYGFQVLLCTVWLGVRLKATTAWLFSHCFISAKSLPRLPVLHSIEIYEQTFSVEGVANFIFEKL
jgi:hypothetical protein